MNRWSKTLEEVIEEVEGVTEEEEDLVVEAEAEAEVGLEEEDLSWVLRESWLVRISTYLELGEFMHVTEKELLFRATTTKVPKFNRTVFDSDKDNRQDLGTINEILGPYSKYVGY